MVEEQIVENFPNVFDPEISVNVYDLDYLRNKMPRMVRDIIMTPCFGPSRYDYSRRT